MLKLMKIEEVYMHAKLSFLKTIQLDILCGQILKFVINNITTKKNSTSYKMDIITIEKYFGQDILTIIINTNMIKNHLKKHSFLKTGWTNP